MSVPQTQQAFTSTTTSDSPGIGSGRSRRAKDPGFSITIDFMANPFFHDESILAQQNKLDDFRKKSIFPGAKLNGERMRKFAESVNKYKTLQSD